MPYENAMVHGKATQCYSRFPTLTIPIADRAKIGKYATKDGPARATRHFSVPETMVKRAKTEYCPPNLPNLKTTNNFFKQICQIWYLPSFPAIQYMYFSARGGCS